jgi:hypothetical protein
MDSVQWFEFGIARSRNQTRRAQPLPMSNRDAGTRIPDSDAHAVRIQGCAGEISDEQRPPISAGFSLPEYQKTAH